MDNGYLKDRLKNSGKLYLVACYFFASKPTIYFIANFIVNVIATFITAFIATFYFNL